MIFDSEIYQETLKSLETTITRLQRQLEDKDFKYSVAIGFINEVEHLFPPKMLEQFREELNNGKNKDVEDTGVPRCFDGVDRDKRNTDSDL